MLGYKYLEALPAVAAGDANKLLLLPAGASDAMGAVAGLGAAFAQGAAPDDADRKPPKEPRRRPRRIAPPDAGPPLPSSASERSVAATTGHGRL